MTRLVALGELDSGWRSRWVLGQQMQLPVARIFVHHTVTADTGDVVRDSAKVHDIDQGKFGKISYSWLVHESSGAWVEGQTVNRGAHTINNRKESLNGVSLGIGVIGNFHPAAPNPAPRVPSNALLELIAAGIREFIVGPGHVAPGFTIDGHRDVFATACCGDSLYAELPVIRMLVSSTDRTGVFMALTDAEQAELLDRLRAMHTGNWVDSTGKGDLSWLKRIVSEVVREELAKGDGTSGDVTVSGTLHLG